MGNVTFMNYNMRQLFLPSDLGDLIPPNHVVRVVNDAIDRLGDDLFLRHYPGGGRSAYHPKMMAKLIVYAYTQRIYSSRQIAKAARENIAFMWIAARQTPDFRTINRFRSERMKPLIDTVFAAVLELLVEEGYVQLEHYFLDGTKIEANANRYTFVWKKATDRYQAKLQGQIRELLREIDAANESEQRQYGERDLEELGDESPITAAALQETVSRLEERLKEEPKNKPLKRAVRKLRRDYLPRTAKYERQQLLFKGRRNYSKTDTDATFMRMKDDHMRNGQLKPGYNVQIGTEGQFILGYSLHQSSTDWPCLIAHLEKVKKGFGFRPQTVIADAGYGSEQNYAFLEGQGIEAYVKYPMFHKEQSRSFAKNIFRVENWTYDEASDTYICPTGNRLTFRYLRTEKTDAGYRIRKRVYQFDGCSGCPLKAQCTKSETHRTISISPELQRFKRAAREKLTSERGVKLMRQRMAEVESVYGQLKWNRAFRRFLLRGLPKVNVEVGLLSIAHNLLKKAAVAQQLTAA